MLPDGRLIGTIDPADIDTTSTPAPGQATLRLVLNWLEELKQRVPVSVIAAKAAAHRCEPAFRPRDPHESGTARRAVAAVGLGVSRSEHPH